MNRSFFDLIQQIKIRCSTTEKEIWDALDITEAEFAALRLIRSGETFQNCEFADKMNISVSRGSRLVNQLQKKGYFQISPVPDNRRSLAISLTAKGASIQTEIIDQIKLREEVCLSHLDKDERLAVYDNLETVIRLLNHNSAGKA